MKTRIVDISNKNSHLRTSHSCLIYALSTLKNYWIWINMKLQSILWIDRISNQVTMVLRSMNMELWNLLQTFCEGQLPNAAGAPISFEDFATCYKFRHGPRNHVVAIANAGLPESCRRDGWYVLCSEAAWNHFWWMKFSNWLVKTMRKDYWGDEDGDGSLNKAGEDCIYRLNEGWIRFHSLPTCIPYPSKKMQRGVRMKEWINRDGPKYYLSKFH